MDCLRRDSSWEWNKMKKRKERKNKENLSYFLKYRNPHLKYCLQLNTKENVGGTGSVNKWSYEEKHSKQE